jgi:hypothetical protein
LFGPFCQNALQEEGVLPVVQMASVALSDSLQLVDDTIRSILASTDAEERDDASMLKQAVEQSSKRFAKWSAAAMERLAGCESSDPTSTIEVVRGGDGDGNVCAVDTEQRQDSIFLDDQRVASHSFHF